MVGNTYASATSVRDRSEGQPQVAAYTQQDRAAGECRQTEHRLAAIGAEYELVNSKLSARAGVCDK